MFIFGQICSAIMVRMSYVYHIQGAPGTSGEDGMPGSTGSRGVPGKMVHNTCIVCLQCIGASFRLTFL